MITSYDIVVGPYLLHVWQMFSDSYPWNWVMCDARNTFQILSPREGYTSENDAQGAALKAFAWYFLMRLLRKSMKSSVVLKDQDGSRIHWK